jgi:hypothetical protein
LHFLVTPCGKMIKSGMDTDADLCCGQPDGLPLALP